MVEKDKTTRIYSFVRPIHHDEKEFYSNNSAQEVYPVQSESAKIVGEALIGLVDITDYMTSFESQPDREFYKSLGVRGYFLPGPGWWITPSSTSASENFFVYKKRGNTCDEDRRHLVEQIEKKSGKKGLTIIEFRHE